MKARSSLLIAALCVISLASCVPTKYMAEPASAYSVKEMVLLQPLAEVSLVTSDSQTEYSESMSITEADLLKKTLMTNSAKVPVSNCIELSEIHCQTVYNAVSEAENNIKSLQGFKLHPELCELIKSSGQRYGLLVVSNGTSRSKQNYRKELLLCAVFSIISLGTVYYIPLKAVTRISAMIVDSETGEVIYFKTNGNQEIEPLDEARVANATLKLFKGFTW